ncbi:MAG TPA: hypothetical protein VGF43_15595 [Dongiaceae bacterium]|jgi:hypothetical protein
MPHAPRKARSPGARLRRLIGKLLGRKRITRRDKSEQDIIFKRLWQVAAGASFHGERFSIRQPNLLLFQMGKVASTAIQAALIDAGINCFSVHELRHEDEVQRLQRLFTERPRSWLARSDLKLLAKHTALHMLVRWHKENKVAADRRLKVVSITRDPVSRYVSHVLEQTGRNPHRLIGWHRAFSGASAADGGDAMEEMLRQVARLLVETRPSAGLPAARTRGRALALGMSPPQPYLAEAFDNALLPLRWFDEQLAPLFGIDIRTLPELARDGAAARKLDFADILVVRFEDLSTHTDRIARFAGLPALVVPPRNVTTDKPYAHEILQGARRFLQTGLGAAFQRELRDSDYGRACGYDRLTEPGL